MNQQTTIHSSQEALMNHMKKHHVSIGRIVVENNALQALPPDGSGTLVRWIYNNKAIYGILTASHVVYRIFKKGILQKESGEQYLGFIAANNEAIISQFLFIEHFASYKEFKNGYTTAERNAHAPDICIIALKIDDPNSDFELFKNSTFYCITEDFNTKTTAQIFSGFYRGACTEEEEKGERGPYLPNTGPQLSANESFHYDQKYRINYWKIPNKKCYEMGGASGAAFWRIDTESPFKISFNGIITADYKTTIYATAGNTVYEFLHNLKENL